MISARRRCCGTEPVCQAASTPISRASSRTSSSMRSHSENTMTLRSGSCEQVGEHALQLLELRADAAGRIEDRRRVADHAHAGEHTAAAGRTPPAAAAGAAPCASSRAALACVLLVAGALLFGHRHEIVLDRAAGQLALDVGLAPAQHHRRHAAAQLGEVLVVDRPAALVELSRTRG